MAERPATSDVSGAVREICVAPADAVGEGRELTLVASMTMGLGEMAPAAAIEVAKDDAAPGPTHGDGSFHAANSDVAVMR